MRKSNFINISVHKKKGKVLRVIENYEKLNAAADIVIKDTKKLTPVNTVEKELVLQDNLLLEDSETFTKSRENKINVSRAAKEKRIAENHSFYRGF